MNLLQLTQAVAAVCPIHGVNSDKVIAFHDEATAEQRAQAQALVDAAELDNLPGVPQEVTMRQARLALAAAGLLSQVEAAIDGMPEPDQTAARIEWEYSGAVQRTKPLVLALAPALGLTEAQLDALFIQAAAL